MELFYFLILLFSQKTLDFARFENKGHRVRRCPAFIAYGNTGVLIFIYKYSVDSSQRL
jgi:hypothetical protein